MPKGHIGKKTRKVARNLGEKVEKNGWKIKKHKEKGVIKEPLLLRETKWLIKGKG